MQRDKRRTPPITDLLLRGLRIGASTVALVELLRSDWIGGGLASLGLAGLRSGGASPGAAQASVLRIESMQFGCCRI